MAWWLEACTLPVMCVCGSQHASMLWRFCVQHQQPANKTAPPPPSHAAGSTLGCLPAVHHVSEPHFNFILAEDLELEADKAAAGGQGKGEEGEEAE